MTTEKKSSQKNTETQEIHPAKRAMNAVVDMKDKAGELSLEQAFEKAFTPAKSVAVKQVERIIERNPDISKKELIAKLERRYISEVTSSGAASGGAAALPGVGTLVGIGTAFGDAGVFMTSTIVHVFSMLKAIDAELNDVDHERALILTILCGGSNAPIVQQIAGRVGPHWAKQLLDKIPGESLRLINKALGRNFVTKYGTKQGIVVLGKIFPFGIGAVVGGGLNYLFGRGMIKVTRMTFTDMFADQDDLSEVISYMKHADLPEEPNAATDVVSDEPGQETV